MLLAATAATSHYERSTDSTKDAWWEEEIVNIIFPEQNNYYPGSARMAVLSCAGGRRVRDISVQLQHSSS